MTRRLESETRRPGMLSTRTCGCGAALPPGELRCADCRPALSSDAQRIGEARRREREAFEAAVRAIVGVEFLIKKIWRKIE